MTCLPYIEHVGLYPPWNQKREKNKQKRWDTGDDKIEADLQYILHQIPFLQGVFTYV